MNAIYFIRPTRLTNLTALARYGAAALMLGTLLEVAGAVTSTSVSQFGITWTFSQSQTVGQYANGDWWVVGPVTITGISPASTTDASGWTINGTMVNPPVGSNQGFDSSITKYASWNGSLNVAPVYTGSPLVVSTGSVVSTISSTVIVTAQHGQVTDSAVLSVVASAPAVGAFRPPTMGSDKTSYWNKSNLVYGILKSLPPVASAPGLSWVVPSFERHWFVQIEGNSAGYIAPAHNMPWYGRDQAQLLALGLLSLHLNYTNSEKETLYIRLVQYGIDLYGSVKAGTVYTDNGGLNAGRKACLVLAGLALNDPKILAWADGQQHFVFAEDRQTWFVTQSDVGRAMLQEATKPRETYTQSMVGMPEWGEQHTLYPNRDDSRWGAYYRWAGGAWMGHILALRLMTGGESAWNYPPVFAYADRYWNIEGQNGQANQTWSGVNAISPFVYDMWSTYRTSPLPAPSSPTGVNVVPK